MCAHKGFKVVAEVRPTSFEGQALPGFDVRMHATCRECGVPLKFRPGGGLMVEKIGLVAVVPAVLAGD